MNTAFIRLKVTDSKIESSFSFFRGLKVVLNNIKLIFTSSLLSGGSAWFVGKAIEEKIIGDYPLTTGK